MSAPRPKTIAFLRAINVGGRVVPMSDLKALFEALGLADVETFIASGNVIFRSPSRNGQTLQRRIEQRLRAVLGYDVPAMLRTDAEVAAIAAYRAFPPAKLRTAVRLTIGLLAAPPTAAALKALQGLATEFDDFHVNGRELHWLARRKFSETTITTVMFERALKAPVTFRGVNTIARLAAKYPPAGAAAPSSRSRGRS